MSRNENENPPANADGTHAKSESAPAASERQAKSKEEGTEFTMTLGEMVDVIRAHRRDLFEKLAEEASKEQEQEIGLESVAAQLEKWTKKKDFTKLAERFKDRIPLGVVSPPIAGLYNCYAMKTDADAHVKPNYPVLIFDESRNILCSGFVESLEMKTKKAIEEKQVRIKLSVYKSHGVRLMDQKSPEDYIELGSIVFTALPEEIPEIYGIPPEGPSIGVLTQNNEPIKNQYGAIPYRLGKSFFESHTCVSGITGAGKSVALKNIIKAVVVHSLGEQLQKEAVTSNKKSPAAPANPTPKSSPKISEKKAHPAPPSKCLDVNCIIFDVQGDLVQIIRKLSQDQVTPELKDYFAELGLNMDGLGDFLSEGDYTFLRPEFEAVEGFPYLMPWEEFSLSSARLKSGEDLCYFMPGLTKTGRELVRNLYDMFVANTRRVSKPAEKDAPFNLDLFYAFFKGGIREDGGEWALPYSDEAITQPRIVVNAVTNRLKDLRNLRVFDHGKAFQIRDVLGKKLSFIYFPKVKGYETVRTMILFQVLAELIEFKKNPPADVPHEVLRKKTIIFIDEAHQLLPSKASSWVDPNFVNFVDEKFAEIAQEGRKYDIILVVASQAIKYLNSRVVEQCQNRIFLNQSQADITTIKSFFHDASVLTKLFKLNPGVGVVVGGSQMNEDVEIKFHPPHYLHEKPNRAREIFWDDIVRKQEFEKSKAKKSKDRKEEPAEDGDQKNLWDEWVKTLEKQIDKTIAADADRRKQLEEKITALLQKATGNVQRVTSYNGRSILEMSTEDVVTAVKKVMRSTGLKGKHLVKVAEQLAVALKDANTVGIKILGPPGEGKTRLAIGLAETFCPFGIQSLHPCSEETLEEDLFFARNPEVLSNPKAEPYKFGPFSNVPFYPTFVILDEANRVPERVYGGKALLALSERRITMPNFFFTAPADWKVVFTLNPLDIGLFKFPAALENRCATLIIPYADDSAVDDSLKDIIPEFPEVITALKRLRRETIRCSQLDPAFKGGDTDGSQEKGVYPVDLNGISMRVVQRIASQFKLYHELKQDKKIAFAMAVEMAVDSVLVNNTDDERKLFGELAKVASQFLN